MTHPTEVKLPESLEVVAWLTSWPKDKVRPAGTIVNRQEPKLKFDCNQYSPLVRLSDAESALKARDAEIERLRGDAERLDWLDGLNRALNKQHGTTYQWKLVLSPNVVRLMAGRHDKGYIGDIDLHDSDARGVPSCRAAIDQARAEGGEKTK